MNTLMRYTMMRDNTGNNTQARFRDRQGREHYDNGRYAPMRSGYPDRYEPPNMGGYGRTPVRSNYEYPYMGYSEPARMGDDHDDREGRRSWKIIENNGYEYDAYPNATDGMRQIYGFGGARVDHAPMDEMSHREGSSYPGHAGAYSLPVLDKRMAEEWMESLQNADGTHGPHWSLEEVRRLMQQKGLHEDPVKLWVAMNAEYSDSVAVNRKFGVDNTDYYLESAKARWLADKDAVPDKLAAYYMYVVKH